MGTPLPPRQKGGGAPKFSAYLYRGQTTGWIKMVLGIEVGLSPAGDFVLDRDQPPPKKGAEPPPNFGPFLLWPNGRMHEDATWYGGRLQPRGLCVRWEPGPLPKRGRSSPIFGPCLLRPNGCMHQDASWYGGKRRPGRHCVTWGHSSPSQQGGGAPSPIFAPCLLWPNGWMHENATWHGVRPQPRGLCVRCGPSPLAACQSHCTARQPLPGFYNRLSLSLRISSVPVTIGNSL